MSTPQSGGMRSVNAAHALILFGATGDLSKRMLLPSLYGLDIEGLLSSPLKIIASGRQPMTDDQFRNYAKDVLLTHNDNNPSSHEALDNFLKRLSYVVVDLNDSKNIASLGKTIKNIDQANPAIFMSTAPNLFETAIEGLRLSGLTNGKARIALEKPLGHDRQSSQAINDAVQTAFSEDRIFRIDHYLGKETVQNLLALRFGNALFEPLWNANAIDHVQITVAETVGVENRGSFYDQAGALRDMVQNHMLQLLALVAMEPPAHFNATEIRDEKVKVLRSLRHIDRKNVLQNTVIGQYGPGAVGMTPYPGYRDDLGASSNSETFVAIKANIDNWRWKGVPFYLRTGKRLPIRQSEILIQFKPVQHSIFDTPLQANKLLIRLQPEESIRLTVMAKEPGLDRNGLQLREVALDLSLTAAFSTQRRRISYERLLIDFIEGDQTLFVRRDEIEAQWDWIDRIRDGWLHHKMQPKTYPAGTWGPSAAVALTEREGVSWHD